MFCKRIITVLLVLSLAAALVFMPGSYYAKENIEIIQNTGLTINNLEDCINYYRASCGFDLKDLDINNLRIRDEFVVRQTDVMWSGGYYENYESH